MLQVGPWVRRICVGLPRVALQSTVCVSCAMNGNERPEDRSCGASPGWAQPQGRVCVAAVLRDVMFFMSLFSFGRISLRAKTVVPWIS